MPPPPTPDPAIGVHYSAGYSYRQKTPTASQLARNIRTIFGDPDFRVVKASDGIEVDLQGWRLHECPETGDIGVAARYVIAPLGNWPDTFWFAPHEPPGWQSCGYAVYGVPDGFWHLRKEGLGEGIHYGRERLVKLDVRRYGAIQTDVFFYPVEKE